MILVGELCEALGLTLADVDAMSMAEFSFWAAYHARHGFAADRIEGAVALAGTAVCRALGGKIDPRDLIPRFGARAGRMSNKELAARMSAIPGAKVKRIPRPERKAGAAREAAADEQPAEPRRRLLNPKKKPKGK